MVYFIINMKVSDGGLYVCMSSYLSFGRNYVEKYFQKTGHDIFLHLKKVPKVN